MDPDLIQIREAAEIIGVSIDTLRRWDESGRFRSIRSEGGHRYYKKQDIEIYLNDLLKLAQDWVYSGTEIPSLYYCSDSSIFQARLVKMQEKFKTEGDALLKENFSLIVSVAGEIGNNSFDHNLGSWPDVSGIFFGYDINKRQVVLADRGQGILKTLKRVKPELIDDQEALKVAFTEVISGRSPEARGNGLKYVRDVVTKSLKSLFFRTGNGELNLEVGSPNLDVKKTENSFHGCIALITF
ncbi:MAG: helix-turn-helix domain-containing protein [Patescibacteria group bacterium]